MENLEDTLENRDLAQNMAQEAHMRLGEQARAATRTAVWAEDGYLFWSGSWSGQPPEGEVVLSLTQEEIEDRGGRIPCQNCDHDYFGDCHFGSLQNVMSKGSEKYCLRYHDSRDDQ